MGAGILPATIIKGSVFFLLGRENHDNHWSDFGGSSHTGESDYNTAIREGYEELDGLLGNTEQLENIVINNLISLHCTKRYTTYVFYVQPEILCGIPYYFDNHRKFINSELVIKNYNQDGLFEKNKLKLFTKSDLLLNYNKMRPFYRKIVKQLLEINEESFDKYL